MTWTETLNATFHSVLIACIPYLLAKIAPCITAAFDWIEAKTSAEWAKRLEAEAEAVVMDLYENGTKIVKAKLADGKFTAEEAREALAELGVVARSRLAAWVKGLPARFQPQINEKVGTALEAALGRLKVIKSIPPATVPTNGARAPANAAGSAKP